MAEPDKPLESQLVDVDWTQPELQELLAKIEGLRLDNRGMFKHRPVVIRSFWPQALDDQLVLAGDATHDLQMARNAACDAIGVSYGAHDTAQLQPLVPIGLAQSVSALRTFLAANGCKPPDA